jgi:hypothetical protein
MWAECQENAETKCPFFFLVKRPGEFQNNVTRTECETHFTAVFVNAMHNNISRVFGSVMLDLHPWQKPSPKYYIKVTP